MGKRPFQKMPLSQRAKQFAPFDALKGFKESTSDVEKRMEVQKQRYLSEDALEELNELVSSLSPKDKINMVVYTPKGYVSLTGTYDGWDGVNNCIIFSKERFNKENVFSIKKVENENEDVFEQN